MTDKPHHCTTVSNTPRGNAQSPEIISSLSDRVLQLSYPLMRVLTRVNIISSLCERNSTHL